MTEQEGMVGNDRSDWSPKNEAIKRSARAKRGRGVARASQPGRSGSREWTCPGRLENLGHVLRKSGLEPRGSRLNDLQHSCLIGIWDL
jgi:hypothetical protein